MSGRKRRSALLSALVIGAVALLAPSAQASITPRAGEADLTDRGRAEWAAVHRAHRRQEARDQGSQAQRRQDKVAEARAW